MDLVSGGILNKMCKKMHCGMIMVGFSEALAPSGLLHTMGYSGGYL